MHTPNTIKHLAILSLLAIGLTACSSGSEKNIEPDTTAVNGQMGGHSKYPGVNFDHTVSIDSSEYVMFPLTAQKGGSDEYGSFGSSGGGRSETYWNIIFYNTATKKYHLLDENSKMIITAYKGEGTPNKDHYSDRFMFYDMVTDDFNKDGKLNTDDPQYLFISDKEGSNLKQVSPKGLHVANWEIIEKTNQILMATQTDTNGDKQINSDDKQTPYIYDLKSGAPATPVFSEEFGEAVSKLFKKQWPVKKI